MADHRSSHYKPIGRSLIAQDTDDDRDDFMPRNITDSPALTAQIRRRILEGFYLREEVIHDLAFQLEPLCRSKKERKQKRCR